MSESEPPRPERGRTAEEQGRDVSEAQARMEAAPTWGRRALALADPRTALSMAEGYPPVVKQFLQLCLLLTYPAWLFLAVLAGPVLLVGKVLEWLLYALFWPVRAIHKRNNPEEYAAFQAELEARKAAGR